MSDQLITLQLEIPPEVAQQDVWDLEEQLSQVTGITTELREPRDPILATSLLIVSIAGGINTIHDLAQNITEVAKRLHAFFHRSTVEQVAKQTPHTLVIITKKGNRVNVAGLTVAEIEELLKDL